jgi:acyl-coenzyme A thioesterase PaaI-like protein
MTQNLQDTAVDKSEMGSLLLGAGFALASLIILPAVAQRIGLGSSLTIALRGALMRALTAATSSCKARPDRSTRRRCAAMCC